MEESTNLWVFGYGSLVWKPGFQPGQLVTGYVEGFARRLWQGNETHRGRPGRPGRVATLVDQVLCRAGNVLTFVLYPTARVPDSRRCAGAHRLGRAGLPQQQGDAAWRVRNTL